MIPAQTNYGGYTASTAPGYGGYDMSGYGQAAYQQSYQAYPQATQYSTPSVGGYGAV